MARNATKPTRRDFVFSSPDLFPAFLQFQVGHADTTPVHATILFQLKWEVLSRTSLVASKPASLGERLSSYIDQVVGPAPIQKGEFDNASFPEQQASRAEVQVAGQFQKVVLAELRGTREQICGSITASFHQLLDTNLMHHSASLQGALAARNPDLFWSTFWQQVENSVCTFTEADAPTRRSLCGRSESLLKTQTKRPLVQHSDLGLDHQSLPGWLLTLRNHMNRCQWLSTAFQALARDAMPLKHKQQLQQQIHDTVKKTVQYLKWLQLNPRAIFQGLQPNDLFESGSRIAPVDNKRILAVLTNPKPATF